VVSRGKALGKQITGSIKEVAGKAVGDSKLQMEGEIDQVEGKAQTAIGKIKDAQKKKAARTARRNPRSR